MASTRHSRGHSATPPPTFMLPHAAHLRHELTIKRSRFIATAARVDSLTAARDFFAHVHAEFPDARHHCTAVRVEGEIAAQPITRSSDDGEPAGTAGRPMLGVLTASGLINAAVVVTRYFGGTLLGTGGLVRAYSDSVRQVLHGAPIVRREPAQLLSVTVPYALAGKLEADLRTYGFEHINARYTAHDVQLQAQVRTVDGETFYQLVAQLTEGAAQPQLINNTHMEIRAGKIALIGSDS
ncbi:MAG: IMPACT family protein [Arcanobacterium sp.]|nr:IMPACT family protein [Arcanobacterium sp.]MDY5589898.1 YigZ family protein [Arcanobacterium sp.]